MRYLPDSPATHVTKEYLFTIVNTVDSTFFAKCVQEIDEKRCGTNNEAQPETVKITENMYELLIKITHTVRLKYTGHSLAGMKKGKPPA